MCNEEQEEGLSLAFQMLIVKDVERALRFYCDVLGLELQSVDLKNSPPAWARIVIDDVIIVLRADGYDDIGDLTGTALYLVREGRVDGLVWSGLHFEAYDIPQLCLRVEEAGGRILMHPRRSRDGKIVADLADTEGNVFVLFSD